MARRVYEPVQAKQTMNRVQTSYMPFSWSINPYRGCAHGCAFCYARATHAYLGMEADDAFQKHIFVKVNAAEALEAQLAKLFAKGGKDAARRVGLVAIGTATDPYQPIEAKMKLTRECLKVLARYRIPFTVTTRSPLILRDVDILREAAVRAIHISVNTLDLILWRRMEPESPSPVKRLETVQALTAQGLNAGVFLAPILPGLTDGDEHIAAVLRAAKNHGARFVVPSVLRLVPEVKRWYYGQLQKYYPWVLPFYERLYRGTNPPPAYVDRISQRAYRWMRKFEIPFYREAAVSETEKTRDGGDAGTQDVRESEVSETIQLTLTL
ncbi:MAG: radical SAM protein [Alicyclobacillaceae bacterium]|nr:radical SAM protein [Alicyclobacillaceae bacterium]